MCIFNAPILDLLYYVYVMISMPPNKIKIYQIVGYDSISI